MRRFLDIQIPHLSISSASIPILICSLVFGLLSACSGNESGSIRDSKKNEKDPEETTTKELVETQGDFFLEDKDCQGNEYRDISVNSVTYRYWNGRDTSVAHSTALSITGSPWLSSPAIHSVVLPTKLNLSCVGSHSNQCRFDGWNYRTLALCREKGDYNPNSFESVALTSMTHIENARSYYVQTNPLELSISRSRLYILPNLTTTTLDGSGYIINKTTIYDNLNYISNLQNSPTFLVYPPSPGSKVRLWESPWALAHEFAHHILSSHSKFSLRYIQNLSPLYVHTSHSYELVPSLFALRSQELDPREKYQAWRAFNEAYADLWAYYAANKSSSSIKNIPCLDITRDVTSPVFADGKAKVVTSQALDTFYSHTQGKETESIDSSCEDSDMGQYHNMGAAIAHAMHELYKTTYQATSVNSKLILLADHLRTELQAKSTPITLEDLTAKFAYYSLLGESVIHSLEWPANLTTNQCKLLVKHFAGMVPHWLKKGYFVCGSGENNTLENFQES